MRIFITVGTTKFDALINCLAKITWVDSLSKNGDTIHLNIQYSNGSKNKSKERDVGVKKVTQYH